VQFFYVKNILDSWGKCRDGLVAYEGKTLLVFFDS